MVGRVSPGTGRPYALVLICDAWRVARSTVLAVRERGASPEPAALPRTRRVRDP